MRSVAFSPDGKTIAAGYRSQNVGDGGVVLWDVAARTPGRRATPREGGLRFGVAFSPDGKTIAVGCSGGRGAVGRGRAQTPGRRATRRDGGRRCERGLQPRRQEPSRPDASGGVVLWDVAARKRLVDEPLAVKEGSVKSVAFSPDGKTIAARYGGFPTRGGAVLLWDVAARKRLFDEPLDVKDVSIDSVAFSPDGKSIAAAGSPFPSCGARVLLWDVGTQTPARRAILHDRGEVSTVIVLVRRIA